MDYDLLQYILLGLIQGFTEFLPISSSAHLILAPSLFGWQDQGLATDVAAHVGTLCAVVWYFRTDLKKMTFQWINTGFSMQDTHSRYAWYLVLATLPVAITGFLASGLIEEYLRSPLVIASTTILFALFLWWTDRTGNKARSDSDIKWKDVLVIGLFQVLALIPGTSRSGITISAGLLLGLDRKTSARFALLLSVPTIFLAGAYEAYGLIRLAGPVDWNGILTVTLTSFLAAALTIHLFIRFVDYTGMLPYVIYRLLLGVLLLVMFV